MHRKIIYNGQLPLETDLLGSNLFAMIGLGRLAMDLLGTSTLASGLALAPTSPASMTVNVGAGAIYQMAYVDASAYSSIAANTTDQIMKQGILAASDAATLTFAAPTTSGYSIIYLVQAAYADVDTGSAILNYYNSANPAVPYTGPAGNNAAQPTVRAGKVNLQIKAGVAGTSPVAPTADSGFAPLYIVTVPYGASAITAGMIAAASGAPFITSLTSVAANLSSYLTTAAAASTYATQTSLAALATSIASTYLTQTSAASTYAPLGRLGSYAGGLSFNANTTLAATQAGSAIQLYGTSAFTVTMPTATSCVSGATFAFTNCAAVAVTIARQSTDTFFIGTTSGLTSITLQPGNTLVVEAYPAANTWVSTGGSAALAYDNPTTTTPPTGDNSQRLATTAYVQANCLGSQQSWQVVTGSRASGTIYTNATGRPINVLIVLPDTSGGSPTVTVTVGGVPIVNALNYDSGTGISTSTQSFIVPPGATYSVTLGGSGGTIASWSELR